MQPTFDKQSRGSTWRVIPSIPSDTDLDSQGDAIPTLIRCLIPLSCIACIARPSRRSILLLLKNVVYIGPPLLPLTLVPLVALNGSWGTDYDASRTRDQGRRCDLDSERARCDPGQRRLTVAAGARADATVAPLFLFTRPPARLLGRERTRSASKAEAQPSLPVVVDVLSNIALISSHLVVVAAQLSLTTLVSSIAARPSQFLVPIRNLPLLNPDRTADLSDRGPRISPWPLPPLINLNHLKQAMSYRTTRTTTRTPG